MSKMELWMWKTDWKETLVFQVATEWSASKMAADGGEETVEWM